MRTTKDLIKLIENIIFESLALQYLEADVRVDLTEASFTPVSEECYRYYEEAFSVLLQEETWMKLHKIARISNIADDRAFENYVDRMVSVINEDKKYPNLLKEITIYHIKSLTLSKCLESINKIQIPDNGESVSDERWYKEFDTKIEKALVILESSAKNSHQNIFKEVKSRVVEKFPKLRGTALDCLVSAEVFYTSFHEEKQIDYAPVMLEYCRCIEILLWDFIDNNELYKEEREKAVSFNHGSRTFGGAVHTVEAVKKGPLFPYHEEYRKLNIIRNFNAHIFVTRKPNVSEVRTKIWETDLLNVLIEG